jgi:hypothetical protein
MGGWLINDAVGTYSTYAYTSFGEDSKGEMYLANILNGTIYSLGSPDCNPVAAIVHNNGLPSSIQFCKGTPFTLHAWTGDSLTYQWLLNGNAIAGATAPTYSADSAGTYTLVTTRNLCSDTSHSVLLVDTCLVIAGMEHNLIYNDVEVFPNPASEQLNVTFDLMKSTFVEIDATNLIGERVYGLTRSFVSGKNMLRIETSAFPAGVYFLRMRSGENQVVKKFLVVRKDK